MAGTERVSNVLRFRGGLVFKAHRLCVSPNSMLESNQAEEEEEERPNSIMATTDRVGKSGGQGWMRRAGRNLEIIPNVDERLDLHQDLRSHRLVS